MNASHTPAPRTTALAALAALALLAGSTHALAQAPQLVRNINPRNAADYGSSPNGLFTLGNRVLFTATSREHGSELWTTDGTAAGTTLLKDIQPGPIGSQPRFFARVGQRVLLTAGNIALGEEVWVTDGTPEGTIPLGDFAAGRIGSAPGNPIVIDGVVHFSARVGTPASPSSPADTLPFRLLSTDGTPAGTVNLGDGLSNPIQIGRRVIFAGADPAGTTGVELFALDLDTGTRTLVANIWPSAGPSDPIARAALPTRALYSAFITRFPDRRGLYATGGTLATSEPLLSFSAELGADAIEIAVVADRAILSRAGSAAGGKLWITDGTRAGTAQLIDLLPGSVNGPLPANLTAWNNQLAFTLATDASGPQIWLVNPATAAAQRLTNLNNTPGSGGPSQLTVVNNRLYFTADTPDAGREAWVLTDPAAAAVMLPEFTPGPASSSPQAFTALDSTRVLYTALVPGSGQELVVSDGSPAGTSLVRDIGSNLGGSAGSQLTAAAGRLYFTAILPETGLEPHRSDGTAAGTSLIGDLVPGPARSFVRTILTNNADAAILWRPSAATTNPVNNLLFDDATTPPRPFTLLPSVAGGDLAFAEDGSVTYFDSSVISEADGLTPPLRVFGGPTPTAWTDSGAGALPPTRFPYAGGWVTVSDTGLAAHIIQSSPNTYTITPFSTRASPFAPPTAAIPLGAGIIFDGPSVSLAPRLTYWEITLSPANVPVLSVNRTLLDLAPDPSLPLPAAARTHLTALTSSLAVFTTYDPALGRELWRTDGTVAGTTLLKDINPGPASARIDGIIALGNRAILAASDGAAGHELWITDGTPAGTTLLLDINPGPASSEPRDFTLAAGKVYFSADDGAAGRELWVTDGTPAGTTRVFDLFHGPLGSNPRNMTDVRGTLFFYADDGIVGDELFSLAVGTAGCNLADVTGPGGPPSGPDGQITGDDFVAFIAAFAEGRPGLADVTGIGGEPAIPDGLLTGDDFIAFISAFAEGCP